MSIVGNIISGFSQGDDLEIAHTVQSIPSGKLLSKVWFMVKEKFTDDDSAAIISKLATTLVTTYGYISDTGADGTGAASIYLTHSDTMLLLPFIENVYSIKVLFSDNTVRTTETGIIVAYPTARQGVT